MDQRPKGIREVIYLENKDKRKAMAVLFVMLIVGVSLVATATSVAADAASDIENLTATTSAMLMALIPLIVTIGIFTLVLGLIAFRGMRSK